MESLAVALLILTLTSQWGGFLYVLKRISDIEKNFNDKMSETCDKVAVLDREVAVLQVALERNGFKSD